MYAAPLTEVVRLERKRCYYDAYHQALKQLLAEKKQRFSDRFGYHLHLYNAYRFVSSHGQRQGCEHHNRRTILYRATVP